MKIKVIPVGTIGEPINTLLPPDQILTGKPEMLCAPMTDNAQTHTGFWSSTRGMFTWIYNCDEVIHILEGEAWIGLPPPALGTLAPPMVRISAGDSVHFPAGSQAQWLVPQYVRKFYVTIDPPKLGFVARLRRKFKI